MKLKMILIAIIFLAVAGICEAQIGGGPGGGMGGPGGGMPPRGMQGGPGMGRGAPQEAITACASKSDGDSCSMTTPNGDTMSGICAAMGDEIACRPAGMTEPGQSSGTQEGGMQLGQGSGEGREPPEELIAACSGKSEGDSCSATEPNGKAISGICIPDAGGYVFCLPKMGK